MRHKAKRKRWDEQLSGQAVSWDGAKIPEYARKRLASRQAKRPGLGLWWKVFEDDGRFALIPKGDVVLTIFAVGALFALLRVMGVSGFGHLVAPLSLILLTLGIGYVLGPIGTVASVPPRRRSRSRRRRTQSLKPRTQSLTLSESPGPYLCVQAPIL